MLHPIKTLSAHTSDNSETLVVIGQVKRELMRTDRYGRRYLRFTVAHPAGSTCCYWFIDGGSPLDGLRHGHHYRIQGETRWTGDREVLVVRAFQAVERTVPREEARKEEARKQERAVRHSAISRLKTVPNRLRLLAQLGKAGDNE